MGLAQGGRPRSGGGAYSIHRIEGKTVGNGSQRKNHTEGIWHLLASLAGILPHNRKPTERSGN